MTIVVEQTLSDQMASALRNCADLNAPGERRAAYCVSGIDFRWRTDSDVRRADAEALSTELNRRLSEAAHV
jgi:hypothetical protein